MFFKSAEITKDKSGSMLPILLMSMLQLSGGGGEAASP